MHLTLAVLTVVTGLGGLGTWYLITRGTDTFTKAVFGWFLAASWSLSVIMPALDHGQISDLQAASLFMTIVFLPAFPFGYIVARAKQGREWLKI
ncbi:MAG: hypothetical protein A3A96_03360 [Candidatus Zambryskibacteria bacterium RIFCSPLOWO2_01_FULL_39_39]|uniref:Uncharacterized protein n=1 Tax=Candidatus Zambryskibacteria bacterium RIFCSPLOWO2_01_FULL_39_39 TaxID=1802758 RepID=A0A1G2TWK5_9BACT|nr:MAG: hypothetical protein A2644_02750 [Candidatus Zambryskibacteria bacterium RIFCSPHIGHO2_01_FULL_39_63]OHA94374.1 MAG: hypothetical protein A3B88_01565 [Candidatus Zambryskibacteria bacterium RIFCSPHIGHO2_02_FULL_39_19]OHA97932.1 MAG: hypothetical protein A3F20_00660 [Candidatus Zambryskibacteria bacterium RIFCSPHIGHO2_12_FULL_39_21]OHB01671.1 MAG: hypothetical protein A3A96_03360 [Candidatus Zambryskibacteria bacterium RIFCSPLOWO2_01_FULL_39_39]